jgi:hypothetical protein
MFGAEYGAANAGTGFGVGTAQEVEDLNKALKTGITGYERGGDQGQASNPSGSPLRVESLESTLKVTTYNERHIVFWRDIPKLPAFNTVEEFNQLNSYGNQGGYFVPEATLPESSDSRYDRKVVQVKYLGTTRAVSHVMTLVRPAHGDVIALETLNGTRDILKVLENALFFGDSACVTYEFDGIRKQLTDAWGSTTTHENIVDMRGQPLDEKTLGDAARVIIDNFGFPTTMYMGFQVMQDLNALFFPKERLNMMQGNIAQGQAGFALNAFQTVGGAYDFRPSVFLKPGRALPSASVGTSANVPAIAGVTISGGGPTSNALSKMAAGSHDYYCTVENRFGESAGSALLATVTYAAGEQSVLTIASIDNAGSDAVTAVNLFRCVAGAGTPKFMVRLPTAAATSITYTERDLNQPGTSEAFLLQMDVDVLSFKQLAPFTKIPLATIDPSIRWTQVLYGTPAVYQPRKAVWLKNIGKA